MSCHLLCDWITCRRAGTWHLAAALRHLSQVLSSDSYLVEPRLGREMAVQGPASVKLELGLLQQAGSGLRVVVWFSSLSVDRSDDSTHL